MTEMYRWYDNAMKRLMKERGKLGSAKAAPVMRIGAVSPAARASASKVPVTTTVRAQGMVMVETVCQRVAVTTKGKVRAASVKEADKMDGPNQSIITKIV